MSDTRGFELEVCVDRFADAMLAREAGATRVEWNQALDLDGLTPSVSGCRWLVRNLDIPVVAMIRPHDRGFMYTDQEFACMLEDCRAIVDAGVAGIVFGALDAGGAIEWKSVEEIREVCSDVELIFHKAFDCLSPVEQLSALPELGARGVSRILTSGGEPTVSEGAQQLKRLCEGRTGNFRVVGLEAKAGNESSGTACEILAGGGVSPGVIRRLHEETGCTQYHGSFRFGAADMKVKEVEEAAAILIDLHANESH
ncbi:MAG: copper homeostasis protein CutC [Pirellulaceae bacterium]